MPKLNENYLNLKESYLFSEIDRRVNSYAAANPDKKVIRLGIGDVTLPIGSEVIAKLHEGVNALASADTFMGYGPYQGYDFCATPSSITMTVTTYRSMLMRYLCLTAQKVIPETSLIYLTEIMSS